LQPLIEMDEKVDDSNFAPIDRSDKFLEQRAEW